jgi:hypothetical protein
VAKNAHTANIDKAEHAFVATGIYPYRPNIISDKDFEPSEITSKNKMPDEDLEEAEDGHSNADFSLRVDGPDLPTLASPRTPGNILPQITSVKGKQRKRKSQESRDFAWNTL